MSEVKQVDVLIGGQGAAAFAAGLYSSRYQVETLIAGEQFGGETAIGGTIENYPGQPDIDGFDLMMKFKEQVDNLETPTVYSNLKSIRVSDLIEAKKNAPDAGEQTLVPPDEDLPEINVVQFDAEDPVDEDLHEDDFDESDIDDGLILTMLEGKNEDPAA